MFSVAVLLLLLAAGSGVNCEQLTQPESLTVRPGQPLTIRCQSGTPPMWQGRRTSTVCVLAPAYQAEELDSVFQPSAQAWPSVLRQIEC
ncbi:unnamed protein product [Gadus morhua 'NCC']